MPSDQFWKDLVQKLLIQLIMLLIARLLEIWEESQKGPLELSIRNRRSGRIGTTADRKHPDPNPGRYRKEDRLEGQLVPV